MSQAGMPSAGDRDPVTGGGPVPRRTLAELIDKLFTTIRPSETREYSYEHVAAAIKANGGPSISSVYIWQLRKGVKDNPTKRHLEALADFFSVPPSYFFDDDIAKGVESELKLLAALRKANVRQIALRASALSDEAIEAIASLVENARRLEKVEERQSDAFDVDDGRG